MPQDVPWAEVTDVSWAPTIERRDFGALVRLTGPCPRCEHQTTTEFAAVVPSKTLRAEDEEEVTLFCKCGYPHKGHPESDNSCGAYWTTTTTL